MLFEKLVVSWVSVKDLVKSLEFSCFFLKLIHIQGQKYLPKVRFYYDLGHLCITDSGERSHLSNEKLSKILGNKFKLGSCLFVTYRIFLVFLFRACNRPTTHNIWNAITTARHPKPKHFPFFHSTLFYTPLLLRFDNEAQHGTIYIHKCFYTSNCVVNITHILLGYRMIFHMVLTRMCIVYVYNQTHLFLSSFVAAVEANIMNN